MRTKFILSVSLAVVLACNSAKTAKANSDALNEPVMADRPNEIVFSESMMPNNSPQVALSTAAKFIASPVLTETEYKGQLAFTTECSRCHDLPKIGSYAKTAWVTILPKMQKKGKTSNEIMQLIETYVNANYEK